MKSKSVKAV